MVSHYCSGGLLQEATRLSTTVGDCCRKRVAHWVGAVAIPLVSRGKVRQTLDGMRPTETRARGRALPPALICPRRHPSSYHKRRWQASCLRPAALGGGRRAGSIPAVRDFMRTLSGLGPRRTKRHLAPLTGNVACNFCCVSIKQ